MGPWTSPDHLNLQGLGHVRVVAHPAFVELILQHTICVLGFLLSVYMYSVFSACTKTVFPIGVRNFLWFLHTPNITCGVLRVRLLRTVSFRANGGYTKARWATWAAQSHCPAGCLFLASGSTDAALDSGHQRMGTHAQRVMHGLSGRPCAIQSRVTALSTLTWVPEGSLA